MKFAKELERDAVPGKSCIAAARVFERSHADVNCAEWRIKYLNYKAGKKYVKAVSRAINRTPRGLNNRAPSFFRPAQAERTPGGEAHSARIPASATAPGDSTSLPPQWQPIPGARARENESLTGEGNSLQYGSFVHTPPATSPLARDGTRNEFELPAPAMRAPPDSPEQSRHAGTMRSSFGRFAENRRVTSAAVPTVTNTGTPKAGTLPRRPTSGMFSESPSHLRRILSHASRTDTQRSSSTSFASGNASFMTSWTPNWTKSNHSTNSRRNRPGCVLTC